MASGFKKPPEYVQHGEIMTNLTDITETDVNNLDDVNFVSKFLNMDEFSGTGIDIEKNHDQGTKAEKTGSLIKGILIDPRFPIDKANELFDNYQITRKEAVQIIAEFGNMLLAEGKEINGKSLDHAGDLATTYGINDEYSINGLAAVDSYIHSFKLNIIESIKQSFSQNTFNGAANRSDTPEDNTLKVTAASNTIDQNLPPLKLG